MLPARQYSILSSVIAAVLCIAVSSAGQEIPSGKAKAQMAEPALLGIRPEVLTLIADTPLMRDRPDATENLEVILRYLHKGKYASLNHDAYVTLMEETVLLWPGSRLAHEGLAKAILGHSTSVSNAKLRRAADEYLAAADIAFSRGQVRYEIDLAEILAKLEDRTALDNYFEKAFRLRKAEDERYVGYLSYARALAQLHDSRAEDYFSKAIDARPQGSLDSYEVYAVYLLDSERPREALDLLNPQVLREAVLTRAFFRGLRCRAWQQLGKSPEKEPECHVQADISKSLSGVAKSEPLLSDNTNANLGPYRHLLGEAHNNNSDDCRYSNNPPSGNPPGCAYHPSDSSHRNCYNYLTWNLAEILENEALGEPAGSRVSVAWTVRDRVTRSKSQGGSLPTCGAFPGGTGSCTSGCPAPTLPDICDLQKRYCCVIHSGAFVDSHRSSVTFQNLDLAFRVIEGYLPDPVSSYPPQGSTGCVLNSCDGTAYCNRQGGPFDYAPDGPIYFYANTKFNFRCLGHQPDIAAACSIVASETCGNSTDGSGSDNCYGRATRNRIWDGSVLFCGSGCTSNGTVKSLAGASFLYKTPLEVPKFKTPGGKAFVIETALGGAVSSSINVQLFGTSGAVLYDFGTQTVSSRSYVNLTFLSSVVVVGPGDFVRVINKGPGAVLIRKVTAED